MKNVDQVYFAFCVIFGQASLQQEGPNLDSYNYEISSNLLVYDSLGCEHTNYNGCKTQNTKRKINLIDVVE